MKQRVDLVLYVSIALSSLIISGCRQFPPVPPPVTVTVMATPTPPIATELATPPKVTVVTIVPAPPGTGTPVAGTPIPGTPRPTSTPSPTEHQRTFIPDVQFPLPSTSTPTPTQPPRIILPFIQQNLATATPIPSPTATPSPTQIPTPSLTPTPTPSFLYARWQLYVGNQVDRHELPRNFIYTGVDSGTPNLRTVVNAQIRLGGTPWTNDRLLALTDPTQWIETACLEPVDRVGVQFWGDENDGWARVLVDGVEFWRANTYGPPGAGYVNYLEISNLPNAPHTLRIEALGVRGSTASNSDIHVTVYGFACGTRKTYLPLVAKN